MRAALVLLIVTAGCAAEPLPAPAVTAATPEPAPAIHQPMSESDLRFCKGQGELAYAIMDGRQAGVPVATAMEPTAHGNDKYMMKLHQLIVRLAYLYPIMPTHREQVEMAEWFRERTIMKCYRGSSR